METEKDFQTQANEAGERFLESARDDLATYDAAEAAEDDTAMDAVRQAIEEHPLSVQVRSGWHAPGEPGEAEEYEVLLGTGGPASRIVGELDGYGNPVTAQFEYQDWFKPWTAARMSGEDQDVLVRWVSFFYFGE